MKYKIKISYNTGDSFHTEYRESFLDEEFTSLNIAEENIQRIKEHDYWITSRDGRRYFPSKEEKKRQKDAIEKAQKARWFAGEHSINLLSDEGKPYWVGCFWVGYFESLVGAEVVAELPGFRK